MAMTAPVRIDPANVQGLVMHVYKYPASRHLLYKVGAPAGGRDFLRWLTPRVTTAASYAAGQPACAVQVGLSFAGIRGLGCLSAVALDAFPDDFQSPPDPERFGDGGPSAVWWNGVAVADLHVLVSLWGPDPREGSTRGPLDALTDAVARAAIAGGLIPLAVRGPGEVVEGRRLAGGPRALHFGYQDGFSLPAVAWEDPTPPGRVSFRHFVLGYADQTTPSAPGPAADAAALALARDGTYLALRIMYQDVAAFQRFLENNADRVAAAEGLPREAALEWLAAKMMGRWRNGKPLALAPRDPRQEVADMNAFDYQEDPSGYVTPPSAHIRVVNPRAEPLHPLHAPVPHLLRRGMPYGEPLVGGTDDGRDRGLIGLFLCSSLARQFEKLLTWVHRNDFSPVFEDLRAQDPIVGNREITRASKGFLIPRPAGGLEIPALVTFVRTKGSAYFLLPSVSGLQAAIGG
jgi:hypothetical protein